MALRADYLIRETGLNLKRNPSLSFATILTVAISLSLVGAALLIQEGVGRITEKFTNDVEFVVWMKPGVPPDQVEGVANALEESPYIDEEKLEYIDGPATFAEFTEFFADEPKILQDVEESKLPTSFIVTPREVDVELIRSIAEELEVQPGVGEVEFESDAIRTVVSFSEGSSNVLLVAAGLAAIAAAMLMYNTIRTAVFARRREIEVMRLVGATKWFIRIPFMLEGLIQGMLGAVVSFIGIFALNRVLDGFFKGLQGSTFRDFALSLGQITTIGFVLLLIGSTLGAVGAGVAVTRYLDV